MKRSVLYLGVLICLLGGVQYLYIKTIYNVPDWYSGLVKQTTQEDKNRV